MAKCLFNLIFALLIALPLKQVWAAEGATDPAARQIEQFYAALVETMKNGRELGLQGRYQKVAPVAQDVFDLPGMARLSVGPSWTSMAETDRNAIVEAFTRMTIASYAKNFATFSNEQFVVDSMVKMRNEDKIVESKLVASDRTTTPFNYRMHLAGDKWKIIDVYLNGYVSQLALRRSDFSSTVASSGPSGLVKKINELVDKQMTGA